MGSAIERLTTEMMTLPGHEWAQLVEQRLVSRQQQAGFWRAEEDELTERLAVRESRRQPSTGYGSAGRLHARFRLVAKGIE